MNSMVITTPAPHIDEVSYFTALEILHQFLNYANHIGEDMLSKIEVPSDNPDLPRLSKWAEVTLLHRVSLGWILYIKLMGANQGSYAIREDTSLLVKTLTIEKLQNYFYAIVKVAEVAKSIMSSDSALNT